MKNTIALVTLAGDSHRTAEENLGLGYLSAALRTNGFNVVVIDGWLYNYSQSEIIQKLKQLSGLFLIGISSYRFSLPIVNQFIATLKDTGLNAVTVAGGYGPTFYVNDYLDAGCDFVLRGESEISLPKLAQQLSLLTINLSGVDGLSWLDDKGRVCNNPVGQTENLDTLAWPERQTIQQTIAAKNPVHICSSRGCLGQCNYCAVSAFSRLGQQSGWRQRNIFDFVDELEMLNDQFGVTHFKVVDDSFIEPPRNASWAKKLADELIRRRLKIKFRTQIKAECLTEELVANLKMAGWFATSVGIENWSSSALARMKKRATINDNRRAIEILSRHGIYTQMGMILFDYQTTLVELQENYQALMTLNWPVYKGIFSTAYVSAGTPLFRQMQQSNLLTAGSLGNYSYEPEQRQVRLAYRAIKAWQNSHAQTIEHAVNPISAPKVLPDRGYANYLAICLKLQRTDLAVFGEVLQLVTDQTDETNLNQRLMELIENHKVFFRAIDLELEALDQYYGLKFETITNPFNLED